MLPLESGLAVLVPEAEPLVRSFRDKYDLSAAGVATAHITLLYPFKHPSEINQRVTEQLKQCFASFRAFDFSLSTIRRLPGGVLYLAPQPDELFRRLIVAVWECYPETPPYGGKYSGVVPHLTVAQLADEQQAEQVAVELERASQGLLPIHATARQIALMDTLTGSWQLRTTIPLVDQI
jgi:2'-5' RNA ligase